MLFGGKKSSGVDLSTERLTAVVDATTGEVAFGTWSGSVTKQAFKPNGLLLIFR